MKNIRATAAALLACCLLMPVLARPVEFGESARPEDIKGVTIADLVGPSGNKAGAERPPIFTNPMKNNTPRVATTTEALAPVAPTVPTTPVVSTPAPQEGNAAQVIGIGSQTTGTTTTTTGTTPTTPEKVNKAFDVKIHNGDGNNVFTESTDNLKVIIAAQRVIVSGIKSTQKEHTTTSAVAAPSTLPQIPAPHAANKKYAPAAGTKKCYRIKRVLKPTAGPKGYTEDAPVLPQSDNKVMTPTMLTKPAPTTGSKGYTEDAPVTLPQTDNTVELPITPIRPSLVKGSTGYANDAPVLPQNDNKVMTPTMLTKPAPTTDSMGYTEDAPVTLPQGENQVGTPILSTHERPQVAPRRKCSSVRKARASTQKPKVKKCRKATKPQVLIVPIGNQVPPTKVEKSTVPPTKPEGTPIVTPSLNGGEKGKVITPPAVGTDKVKVKPCKEGKDKNATTVVLHANKEPKENFGLVQAPAVASILKGGEKGTKAY